MGGAALHRGNIAEMRTGEGKTLVATLPSTSMLLLVVVFMWLQSAITWQNAIANGWDVFIAFLVLM